MDRPRVLFVSANETAPAGASETTWTAVASGLRSRGFDVWCSTRHWPQVPAHLQRLSAAGCVLAFRSQDPVQREPWELPYAERDHGVIELCRPRLVVLSQGDNWEGLGWMERCVALGVPFVVVSNSASDWFWPEDRVALRLAEAYRAAEATYFVSRQNLELTELQIGHRLHNGAVTGFPYKVPHDVEPVAPTPSPALRLACVARLNPPSKGQDVLFRVLARKKWRERAVSVSMFGEGPHEQVLRRLAALLELDNVSFRGHVADIPGIWRDHDALVLPSREEGFPAVIVEAALCGRPAVVTDVAGNTVLIRDGHSGFVAESPTEPALDRALEDTWNRRSELAELGRNARDLARELVSAGPTREFEDAMARILGDG